MDRRLQVLEKLTLISEQEWQVVVKKAKDHVKIRLRNKTSHGVHCDANLSMSAEDYYTGEAVKKLYSGDWDWKFETFTLLEQIIRIINSMISTNVKKWEKSTDKRLLISELDANIEIPDSYEENEDTNLCNENVAKLEKLIGNDEDCYMLLHGIIERKTFEEICELIGCQKKKLYKIIEKLRQYIKIRDEPL